MADATEDRENILIKIINVYTPFLKKLVSHLGKKDDSRIKNSYNRLKYVCEIFRDGDVKEKLEVYEACKEMLEKWYQRYKDVRTKQDDDSKSEKVEIETFVLDGPEVLDDSDFDFSSTNSNSKDEKMKKSKTVMRIEDEIETNSSEPILPIIGVENPDINIKKEKVDKPNPIVNSTVSQLPVNTPATIVKPVQTVIAMPVATIYNEPLALEENVPKEVTFVCASCQFRTTDEVDFMKHARTDHRTDLSLWCKNCGKCFSNAGVLVSHIKEANCTKEEMIYRCGVKDCTFETPSGQTFVHHLRHCHKGSPFIFCVHCQKIFTLPHCLILHMQNDCPFKDKNRKNPGEAKATENAKPAALVSTPKSNVVVSAQAKPVGVKQELLVTSNVTRTVTLETAKEYPMPSPRSVPTPRGRGRASTRGRWARNSKFSDSSDSDDPDDPSWRPEETSASQPLRRSARWARRVSEAKNPDLEEDASVAKKSKCFIEEPASRIVHCPCCNFSAAFESLLTDHYVASHKHEKKNACLICNVKFENVDLFINHFSLHEKNKNSLERNDISESSNDSSKNESTVEEVIKPAEKKIESSSEYFKDIPVECVPGKFTTHDRNITQIPYQTAIHEKITKDSRVKSFGDLKSATDITKMQSEPKLKHFFKCTVYNCTFTTDDDEFYMGHLSERHKDKKVHCSYCFQEFSEAKPLVEHMFREHSKRCYQCSACFYRAFSKAHIQIHIRHAHKNEKAHIYSCSLHLRPNYVFHEEDTNLLTTYPFICAVGDCKYQSFDPKEFTKHTDLNHRSVSQLYCYYCKGDFISLKRLLSHYHLHGINNFQCNYCVHGSETKEEILLHLCNSHADKAFKVYIRDSQEAELTNKSGDVSGKANAIPIIRILPQAATVQQSNVSHPNQLTVQKSCISCPKEVQNLDEDIFCRMVSCQQECKNFNMYLNHLKEEHFAINILCPYCSVVCDDCTDFENHIMCHGPNLYACPAEGCQLCSFKKNDVKKHMEIAHKLQTDMEIVRENLDQKLNPLKINSKTFPKLKNKPQFYVCPFCYYENIDCKLMKNHIYAEFMYTRFQCNLCKGKLCSRSETSVHFAKNHMHHNVKCEVNSNPEIEFLTKIFLSVDIQNRFIKYLQCNSTENDVLFFAPEYKCEQCNLSFKDIAEWQYHWKNCISDTNKLYVCNYCAEKFGDVACLKYHTKKDHVGHTVSYTHTENALQKQTMLRMLQLGKLKFFKSLLGPYLRSRNLYGNKLKSFQFESKYYKCRYCNFNDTFRSNIKKHNIGCHKDKSLSVEKVKNSVDIPENYNNQVKTKISTNADQNLKAEKMPENKPFICSFCDEKVQKLEELEQHVANTHAAATKDAYPFYYFPDSKWECTEKDTELYDCAYCSVSQENLFHLKRHCNNLHSGVPFKVRGMRSNSSPAIQCSHCDLKVVSQELLEKHCSFYHPKTPLKVLKKEGKRSKRKYNDNGINGPSTKVLKKNNPNEYQCGYCDESFLFYIQMLAHHEAEHYDTSLKFSKGSDLESTGAQLISCDFCPYLAEHQLMNNHLSNKHKHCYVCGYCGEAFSITSGIVNHVREKHKNLPVQVVKVDDFSPLFKSGNLGSSTLQHSNDDLGFSYYGTKPTPIDLHNITVNLASNVSSNDAQLPVIYLSQMFPMFPVVHVEDFAKSFIHQ